MDHLVVPNIYQFGSDRGRGNLLGVEPYMTQQDFVSKEAFFKKLNGYLSAVQRQNWLNEKTIVIFPEYIGSWLALIGEDEKIVQASSIKSAERAMIMHHPWKFAASFLKSPEKGKAEAAFFRMKAFQMAEIYQEVFSQLAREHAVTIVAGSIVLPAPQIVGQQLILNEGPLYNVSMIFQSDGIPLPQLVHKAFPTSEELPFLRPASPEDIPSFVLPAGRLGVLICADSWFPQAYASLKKKEIDILAVPSYTLFGMEKWNGSWPGYDGWPAPIDVDENDIEKITEAQAWGKYSLAGRIRLSGATYGMNIFMRGKLWDQDLGVSAATLMRGDDIFVEPPSSKAALLNLWL